MAQGDALAAAGDNAAAVAMYSTALTDFDAWAKKYGGFHGILDYPVVKNSPYGHAKNLSKHPDVLAEMPLPLQLACALLSRRSEISTDIDANGVDARRALQLDRSCECTRATALGK